MSPVEEGKAKCFAVRRGDIIKRADATSHQPWVRARLTCLEEARFPAVILESIIHEIRYGTGTPPPYLEPSADTAPFVRATDIKNGEINTESLLNIAASQPPFMDKCRLAGGELIIVRSGVNTGDCAVVPASLAGAYAAYDLLVTFKSQASVRFVALFLDTEIGRLQLNLVRGRAAQPHINAEEVSALRIPLPTPEIQHKLVAAMDAARTERQAKLAEADALLAGLDGFVLSTLGLNPAAKDDRKVFGVRRGFVSARFDPHFHLPALMQNAHMLADYGAERLGQLVKFSDEVWNPAQHTEPTFCYVEIGSVNPNTGEAQAEQVATDKAPSRARMVVRTHDIIVSMTRPHHGSIAQITAELDGCIASTGFSVLREIDEGRLSREYLWCVLRTRMCLSQMLQRASGGNYPAITESELAKILIPVPERVVQETIAAEALRRQEEARRLRAEAEAGWQAAKRWFEEQLLGEAKQ